MRRFSIRPTARGLTVALGGLLLTAIAGHFGEPDIVWLGIFLLGLPLLGLVTIPLWRPQLSAQRTVEPDFVPIGNYPYAKLLLTNKWAPALTNVFFTDELPAVLGHDATFSLGRGLGRWQQNVSYNIRADHRGHFQLGPLWARSQDPLGMVRIKWCVAADTTRLRVTPRIWPLDGVSGRSSGGTPADATPQRRGMPSADDVLIRDHRPGDDLRRVHWRASAKQGQLMVRLEESPWEPTVLIFVDTRLSAHLREGPNGTLEWSISLVASVADDLLAKRHRVTMLSTDGLVLTPSPGSPAQEQEQMLDAMTEITPSDRAHQVAELDVVGPTEARSLICALGLLQPADATGLIALAKRAKQLIAVAPDAASFGVPHEVATAHNDALRLLSAAGCLTHQYQLGETVPQAWRHLNALRGAK